MSKPDLSGRVTKWVVKLGAFDIRYQPKIAQKSQVISNFLVECYAYNKQQGNHDEIEEAPNKDKAQ